MTISTNNVRMATKVKKWLSVKRTRLSFHSRILESAKKGTVETLRQVLHEQHKVQHSKRSIQEALCVAIDSNNPQCVRLLLEAGATPNSIKSTKQTVPIPLYVIQHGLNDILLMLIEHGCRVNQGWMNNNTILHFAVRTGNLEAVKHIVNAGGNSNASNEQGESPLQLAIQDNNHAVLDCMLKQPSVLPLVDIKGRTPLHVAAATGSVATLKLILEHGFHPGVVDDKGYTPLMEAVLRHREDIVEVLCQKCDVDYTGKRGMTCLLYATQINGEACAKLLLSAGASPNVKDAMGNSPLILAGQNTSLLLLLLSYGADPDVQNNYGMTSLWYAAFYEYKAALILLLQANSNPELKAVSEDEFHTSPLEIALKTGHYATSKKIIYSGCDSKWLSRFMINADLMHVFRTNKEGKALKIWIREWLRRVKSLRYLAMTTIRKSMGSINVIPRVSELPLPKELIHYVNLNDLQYIE